MKLDKAIDIIELALMAYCEDCVSDNPKELKRTRVAWDTILGEFSKEGVALFERVK